MSLQSNIQPLTISQLFTDAQYTIPVYQRNYAWGSVQIEQLIQDIYDQWQQHPNKNYYLGSLVVFARSKNTTQPEFETIDGQQRHTTLSIILAAFRHEFKFSLDGVKTVNLNFDSRMRSQSTLNDLFEDGLTDYQFKDPEPSMLEAYSIAVKYLQGLFNCNIENYTERLTSFWDYFTKKVIILRSPVPHDTDLNHYFEIMNNRGEQLEKHEVLKARLMKQLPPEQHYAFGQIWDACADMNRYVQYGFSSTIRRAIFGKELNDLSKLEFSNTAFKTLVDFFKRPEETEIQVNTDVLNDSSFCLESLFKNAKVESADSKKEQSDAEDERFGSIINFPNFLMQTLSVLKKGKDIPLDDKRLLDVFDSTSTDIDAAEFIMALLKARLLFDKYVIKRERDKDWSLKKIAYYELNNNINYINTFAKNQDDSDETEGEAKHLNHHIKMIIAMLHVSFPSMIYKNWLNGVLHYLFNKNSEPKADEFLNFLETFNDRIFFGLFGKGKRLSFEQIIYTDTTESEEFDENELNHSTNIQNYIFNRLDYAIWKKAVVDGHDFKGDKKRPITSICKSFSFSLRSSVEHHYPQHPIDGHPKLVSDELSNNADSFGNLCLISRSRNSKLSNLMPKAKKDHYLPGKNNLVESLKQQLMLCYDEWNNEHVYNINDHESEMIKWLLNRSKPVAEVK